MGAPRPLRPRELKVRKAAGDGRKAMHQDTFKYCVSWQWRSWRTDKGLHTELGEGIRHRKELSV